MSCSHDGFHTGQGRYSRESEELRYVLVCDDCAQELSVVHTEAYRPDFHPDGHRPSVAA